MGRVKGEEGGSGMRNVGIGREVRRSLRIWRKRGGEGMEYRKEKQEYKEKRKKGEENEKWERKAKEARREKSGK